MKITGLMPGLLAIYIGLAFGGAAQADFGEALAEIAGVERKIHFFAVDLPHSDACFVQAYPAETTEAFCDVRIPGEVARESAMMSPTIPI